MSHRGHRGLIVATTVIAAAAALSGCDPLGRPDSEPELLTPAGHGGAETTGAPKNENWCTAIGMARSGLPELNVISYCDGAWAYAGHSGTDHTQVLRWEDDSWVTYEGHGTIKTGLHAPCYDADQARADGMPEALLGTIPTCGAEPSPAAPPAAGTPEPATETVTATATATARPRSTDAAPACDGRNILIVESVRVAPGEAAQPKVDAALARHPNAQAMPPGQCSSLRARYEGDDVYAIYVDYGSDTAGVCRATNNGLGQARILTSERDYTNANPC